MDRGHRHSGEQESMRCMLEWRSPDKNEQDPAGGREYSNLGLSKYRMNE